MPTEGVLPLTTMSAEVNVTRLDQVGNQLNQDEALKNAPKQENGFFSVPKVME